MTGMTERSSGFAFPSLHGNSSKFRIVGNPKLHFFKELRVAQVLHAQGRPASESEVHDAEN